MKPKLTACRFEKWERLLRNFEVYPTEVFFGKLAYFFKWFSVDSKEIETEPYHIFVVASRTISM